ncbi:MAG: TRAM domain-containing protein [Propioniciclava sp.]|uniref:class I SAM-dependent RNA methyltransferase n=1 Tax=Propioniciclava sp. TaxID=2038686 RepID=UPI0039E4E448
MLSGVRIGPVAAGGHWVARHEGRVVFVRHGLEGELAEVRVTAVAARHAFADAVAITEPAEHRVVPPCPVAAACGGCDFQHVEAGHQRELKRQVVAEQLRRFAGLDWDGSVEEVLPAPLGWRRRMRYQRADGGWGLRAKASHAVVPLPDGGCRIATPGLAAPDSVLPGDTLIGADAADGPVWVEPGSDAVVAERALGRAWQVRADGFWQVHPRAPEVLADAVLAGLSPRAGERALDLYCGVGLFAGALTGAGAQVTGIEGGRTAVDLARRNVPQARFHAGSVDRVLRRVRGRVDLVVLDPPRAGAGRAVIAEVLRRRPRAVAYVSCDPATLARDLATASALGYRTDSVRAFDLFPMTAHLECVAILRPDA